MLYVERLPTVKEDLVQKLLDLNIWNIDASTKEPTKATGSVIAVSNTAPGIVNTVFLILWR